ncbi:MAG: cupin domain-containing protein [Roseibium album]|uniref:Cupin domain protein n=1 Tax=Roseibium album TaxID=311410 RepID=A0A0M6ZCV7_9HYPH|nr:cupin domain-containing protein [Roseibium album]MBG6143558.1 quercetin dioxygenase-like cupin family protein [Labrenzia sp. EL_142]MBG6158895.1 quercetin dioxygenase-like cupin family protein [Labrenzia sp. EL_162]MBG6160728.1 quercetin dioxygenase-like cupin family protein [Labrenzia sp. EL_195]MBG6175361.1 quercetin dioxygenase-like cupin family protein [Labrenzia sp. EL_132]MBG6197429.1 quercetin dioxygenase-like cupin family protein [Labrenzia sp. EL_159]MBG6203632.1 quercetin dioxyge
MLVHSDAPSAWMDSGPGARRRILCENKEIMMVEFRFEKGGEGLPHNHPHVQTTYVASGRFRFTVEGETNLLGPGDAMVIPSNAVHSCVCEEAGNLLDAFTPRRDDFLEAHGWQPS